MVSMDRGGTRVADLNDDGEELDNVEVARRLQKKLNDFDEGEMGESTGLELRSFLKLAASRNIVSVDLSPALWRTLPRELLILVLARLPLVDITRLRSLSKEWNREMMTVNSEINRALDLASPTMVAGFSCVAEKFDTSEYLITICDLRNHRSHYSYRLRLEKPVNSRRNYMGAHDGGLVCFAFLSEPTKCKRLSIVVLNLLTRVQHEPPPLHYAYSTLPKMMQIEVDSETKCYRVMVVWEKVNGHPAVEIYHSAARQWTKATPSLGCIFGFHHSGMYRSSFWAGSRTSTTENCVYDFAEGELKCWDLTGPFQGACVITYVCQKDYMLVLHKNTSKGENSPARGYCITKYCIQTNAKDWVQERSYMCSPFQALLPKIFRKMSLTVCEGFLMLFSDFFREYFWLLDLSSGEWSRLPNCFEESIKYRTFVSRATWNVLP